MGWGVKTVGIQREGRREDAEKTKERHDNRDRGEREERHDNRDRGEWEERRWSRTLGQRVFGCKKQNKKCRL